MSTPRPPSESAPKQQSDVASAANDETAGLPGSAPVGPSGHEFLAPPQKADEIGRLSHYRVLRQLGAGGMGMVFQAEDTTLDRLVALKVMHSSMAANATARERFIREAKAAAKVKHDHIVSIHQVGEDRGVPFIALEFLQGQPLDAWLKKNPRATVSQALRIGREMAEGLAAAHDRGLIHRDIKPANVWLEAPKGRVKILDFGLARATNDDAQLTREGAVVGTPAYMSPEQARGESLDSRTDLFSLGVVLYRMLSGVQPFTGSTTLAVLMSLGVDNPPPVRDKNPEVPESLSSLVMRLLNKDRNGRPASAAEVSKELQAIGRELAKGTARSGPMQVIVPIVAPAPLASPWDDIDASSGSKSVPSPQAIVPTPLATMDVTAVSGEKAAEAPRSPKKKLLIGAGLLAALVAIVVGVIITIKGPDGKETTLDVPDGSKVKIDAKGQVAVTLPKETPRTGLTHMLKFAANSDRVEVRDLPIDVKRPFTMEGWLRFTAPSQHFLAFLSLREGLHDYVLFLAPGAIGFDRHDSEGTIDFRSPQQFKTETVHVAGVWDGTQQRLFVNGRLAENRRKYEALKRPEKDSTPLLMIGGEPWNSAPLNAVMLGVRVSQSARYKENFTPAAKLEADPETIALYRFDEGQGNVLHDSSGNNHHGTILGAKWAKVDGSAISPPAPQPDFALLFAEGKSHVELPPNLWDGKLPLTIEARVRVAAGSAQPHIICKLINGGACQLHMADKSGWWSNVSNGPGTGQMTNVGEPGPTHVCDVALVIGNGKVRIFEDGRLRKEEPLRHAAFTAAMTPRAWLGAEFHETAQKRTFHFSGTMDEVRISRAVRYEANYQPARRLETDKDTLALYHFDEGQGDVLTDSSSNNHHGKITGATWVKAENAPPPVAPSRYKLIFNGKDDYVSIPSLVPDFTEAMTYEAWVELPVKNVASTPFIKAYGKEDRFDSVFKNDPGRWFEIVSSSSNGSKNWYAGAGVNWRGRGHVAITVSPQKQACKIYFNGKPQNSLGSLGPKPKLPGILGTFLGGTPVEPTPPANRLTGSLAEVRISKGERYVGEFSPATRFEPDAQTIALYHFDEGGGDVLRDSSGNNHHGQIVGAKWVKVGEPMPSATNALTSTDYEWTPPVNLGPNVNTDRNESLATLSTDGLVLAFVASRTGEQTDLFECKRAAANEPFGPATPLSVNTRASEYGPWLSEDGLTLFFDSTNQTDSRGNADLYFTRRKDRSSVWEKPTNLGPGVNTEHNEQTPVLSSDGLTLYFSSDRPGGQGLDDLWAARRNVPDGPFGNVVNLGPVINGPNSEKSIRPGPDGQSLVFSRIAGNVKEPWVAVRGAGGGWSAVALSLPDRHPTDVVSHLTADGRTLYFSSGRPGGHGGLDLWVTRRVPKAPVDPAFFNGKDLTGWVDPDSLWIVNDGAIATVRKPHKTANLLTPASYRDFEMECEVELTPQPQAGGNLDWGIRLRTRARGQETDPGLRIYRSTSGSINLSGAAATTVKSFKPAQLPATGKVETFSIRVVGQKVTAKIDDVLIIDRDFDLPPEGAIGFVCSPDADVKLRITKFVDLSKVPVIQPLSGTKR